VQRNAERESAVAAFVNEEAGNSLDTPLAQSVIEQTTGILTEVEAFATSILRNEDPPVDLSHAVAVMRALLAIETSSHTGREVRL
jgi:predicted dehydrogenase